jgi:phosphonate transport system substrate-binding protein
MSSINRGVLKALMALGLVCTVLQQPAVAQAQSDYVLAVSEGSSGGLDHAQVVNKYKGLADTLGRALKKPVNVVFAREFSSLDEGTKTGRYDFVIARPSNYPAKAIRDYGYSYVASAKPEGQCLMIVPKGSAIKTLAEIKKTRIVLPEKSAYMTHFCTAELRDKGILLSGENVTYVREQAAVGFYIDQKLADVGGVASYSGLAKTWEKNGNRILHKSVKQPYFPLIAHKKFRPEQLKAIQQELVAMGGNPEGQEVLKRIGIEEFDVTSGARLGELLKWLDEIAP